MLIIAPGTNGIPGCVANPIVRIFDGPPVPLNVVITRFAPNKIFPLNEVTVPVDVKLPTVTFPVKVDVVLLVIALATKAPANVILLGKSTVIVPEEVIGLLTTVSVELSTPTRLTIPIPLREVFMVTLPVLPLISIPEPALILVTPVLVSVIVPLLVIGPPVILNPYPPEVTATLVTVPETVVLEICVILPYASTEIAGVM